jgi:hypothetical protein
LEGADALLPDMAAEAFLADKAFDADERVIEPLLARGKSVVIPPKSNRKVFPRSNPPRGCYHLAQLRTGPSSAHLSTT